MNPIWIEHVYTFGFHISAVIPFVGIISLSKPQTPVSMQRSNTKFKDKMYLPANKNWSDICKEGLLLTIFN